MKKLLFLLFIGMLVSCSTTKMASPVAEEEQFFITRKFIGNFEEYYHTGPQIVGGVDLIWIKTSVYNKFGKLSAYGKTCKFSVGDKIYLKLTNSTPGNFGDWVYQIENDSAVNYRVSEFRFENNSFTRTRSL